ncbi:hypothetical protein, partial [Providencia stuartii]|uniref:hypothetical protein n=1 Tax=Providencia stuartii TaxID=588 RepID=UPI001953B4C6
CCQSSIALAGIHGKGGDSRDRRQRRSPQVHSGTLRGPRARRHSRRQHYFQGARRGQGHRLTRVSD